MKTPQHDKLATVKDFSQAIGEFLEWAEGEGMMLCERTQPEDYYDSLMPIRASRTRVLADYFRIDLDKLEEEKLAILEEIRANI